LQPAATKMKFLKQAVNTILRMLDLELHWIKATPPSAAQVAAMQLVSTLRKFKIYLIFGMGVNQGMVASVDQRFHNRRV